MGLAQRRISAEFQELIYPAWKKDFDKAVGFEIPIDVHWDTMMSDDYDRKDDYFQWYQQVYFKPLLETFKALCADKMGKGAVKEGVKKIIIDGTEGSYAESSTFENGVFTLNHKFNSNVDYDKDRADGWRKMLENKL